MSVYTWEFGKMVRLFKKFSKIKGFLAYRTSKTGKMTVRQDEKGKTFGGNYR